MSSLIHAESLGCLRRWIIERRMSEGFQWLDDHRADLERFEPSEPGAILLLGYVAQWVDAGYRLPTLLRHMLDRIPPSGRDWLTIEHFAHLKLAEAVLAMLSEEPDRAIERLRAVLNLEPEIRDRAVIATANFWIARCLRKKGRYDDALAYALAARTQANEIGHHKMAAIVQVLEVWLYFQKGKPLEAATLLKEAGAVLAQTDDYISRGNIESAFGRIARRGGRYQLALDHFDRAIEEYKRRDARHPHLARTLVNSAFVRRLMALQLHKKLDEDPARRGRRQVSAESRAVVDQLRSEAEAALQQAAEIYREHGIHAGLGNTFVNLGHLYLDRGDLDLAAAQADAAYEMGEEKTDFILMARSRILQSMIENEKYEEQIEHPAGPGYHAQLARDLARDGVELAERTQNRRLIARSYVWQGLTLCSDYFPEANGRELARQFHDRAAELLRPEPQDYIWADLQVLKDKSFRTDSVNATLMEWSQGQVGDKTFQQIAEEFAELIIPKVWEREGRKVARVAKRLSVSPKKVRRILANRGLLDSAK